MPQVYELGTQIMSKFEQLCQAKSIQAAPVSVLEGSFTQIDWSTSDITFLASVYFPDEEFEKIADQIALLKNGSRLISLKEIPQRSYIKMYAACRARFSWGLH